MKKGSKQDGRERIETTTVICVQATKGGKMTEMLKEKEEELSRIIKLGLLFCTDLGVCEVCGRNDYQPCESRVVRRPNCKAQSIPS